jgi:hypothetical protein
MRAPNCQSYTHLIAALGIVWQPSSVVLITSPHLRTHDIGRATSTHSLPSLAWSTRYIPSAGRALAWIFTLSLSGFYMQHALARQRVRATQCHVSRDSRPPALKPEPRHCLWPSPALGMFQAVPPQRRGCENNALCALCAPCSTLSEALLERSPRTRWPNRVHMSRWVLVLAW